jgi:hypothetical protein
VFLFSYQLGVGGACNVESTDVKMKGKEKSLEGQIQYFLKSFFEKEII